MNLNVKLKVVLAGIFLIWVSNSGCMTNVIAKECSFYEPMDLSPESEAFLDRPEDLKEEDTVLLGPSGGKYYRYAPDKLFEDMKPAFRNKRNGKKTC